MILRAPKGVGVLFVVAAFFFLATAQVLIAAPKKSADNSDLNGDGVVDNYDLAIFASEYLGEDAALMDWCGFIDATGQDAELYGRQPDYYTKHFPELLNFINDSYCALSDMNGDGRVNARDLMAFSEQYIGEHFLRVDWCAFLWNLLEDKPVYGHPADYYWTYYASLLLYIQDNYDCSDVPPPGALALENFPKSFTRMAASRNFSGEYYVTDVKVGSVFIFEESGADLVLNKELKGLAKPIGIAVNSSGHILVGNDKRNNVEVYDPDSGELLSAFGETEIEIPVSITVDSSDKVYVTDAGSNTVYVYTSDYQFINSIGKPGRDEHQLFLPGDAALSVNEDELLVLDRLNRLIKIYDLNGNYLRAIHPEPPDCHWWTGCSGGTPFSRLQAMDLAPDGTLHVLDIFDVMVAMFNSQNGEFVSSYGSYGNEDGQLRLPMDVLVEANRVLVLDSRKLTIEVLALP
jgi:hypothetical protein